VLFTNTAQHADNDNYTKLRRLRDLH